MDGIYRIMKDKGFWCVAHLSKSDGYWHRVSELYCFRGWAQNYARRMGIKVINYDSRFA